MKRFLYLAALLLSVACAKSHLIVSGVVAMGSSDGTTFITDEGVRCTVTSCETEKPLPASERLYVIFDIIQQTSQGYDIRVTRWTQPLVKDYLTASSVTDDKALGDAPVKILGGWTGGGYLNLDITLSLKMESETKHLINLVVEDPKADADTLRMTLRHHSSGESLTAAMLNADTEGVLTETYAYGQSYVCFPTRGLLPDGKEEMPFKITSTWITQDEQGGYVEEKVYSIGNLKK